MFVDSDDWVDHQYVETYYNEIVCTNAEIVFSDYYESRNGTLTYRVPLGTDCSDDTELLKHKYAEHGGPIWSAIYRRELFFDNNLFFPEHLFYEDNGIAAAIVFSAKSIVKINKPLCYYRILEQSTTRLKNDERFFHRLETSIILVNHFKRLGLFEKYRQDIVEMFLKLYYRNSILGIFEHFNPVPFNKISEIVENTKRYVSPDELQDFLSIEGTQNKILLRTANYSPKLSYLLFNLRGKISKMLH